MFCPWRLAQFVLEFSLNQGQDFIFKESRIQGLSIIPVYKSELPSQVAIFLIRFFCILLKDIPEHVRRDVI